MLSGNLDISLIKEEKPIKDLVEDGLSFILITLCAVFKHYTPAI